MAKIEYNLVKKWYDEMFPEDEEIVEGEIDPEEA